MSKPLSFTVEGHAEPAGSKRAVPAGGRWHVVDANRKAAGWKKHVAEVARRAMLEQGAETLTEPCVFTLSFHVSRPASHFRKDGSLNPEGERNPFPAKRPDLLKLARGVEDALTEAGVYSDDALIVSEFLTKEWGEVEHVEIFVAAK